MSTNRHDLFAELFSVEDDHSWRKRCESVVKLASLIRSYPESEAGFSGLIALVEDPKWEVRRAVAENLRGLPQDLFEDLCSRLLKDSNLDVRNSARHALRGRQRIRERSDSKQGGLVGIEAMYEQMARRFGRAAVDHAREIAKEQMKRSVGFAVHDIRNEIKIIKQKVDEMAPVADNEAFEAAAGCVVSSADKTLRMLADLLDYSNPRKPQRNCENLADLGQRCITALGSRYSRDGTAILFCVDIDQGVQLWIDRDQIERVLTNIFKNAVESFQHPKCQQVCPRVTVAASISTTTAVTIIITDNGQGMREADLLQVCKFEPIRSNKPEGTGFGLPSAAQIIAAHGGDIEMDSQYGCGTRVSITLPVHKE